MLLQQVLMSVSFELKRRGWLHDADATVLSRPAFGNTSSIGSVQYTYGIRVQSRSRECLARTVHLLTSTVHAVYNYVQVRVCAVRAAICRIWHIVGMASTLIRSDYSEQH